MILSQWQILVLISAAVVSAFAMQPDQSFSLWKRTHNCPFGDIPQYQIGNSMLWSKRKETSSTGSGFGVPKKNDLQGKLRSVSNIGSAAVGAGSKQLRQAALTFDRIRKARGKEASNDVYIRSPLNSTTTFWFVGKVAFENDSIGGAVACLSQKRLILEYSRHHLRPQNLGGKYASTLELWLAPPDSEMDVAQNKVTLQRVVGSAADLPEQFHVASVGYNPEIYVGDEVTQGGLRVERDEQGRPTKPVFEVQQTVDQG
jgi:hypothetical protein